MVQPFLLLYCNRYLHFDLVVSGQLAAVFSLGSVLAAPLGGVLADRYDCVRCLALALILGGLGFWAIPIVHQPFQLGLMIFLAALLMDISRPCNMTSIARLTEGMDSRPAFSLNYMAVNLGMSIGPTIGGYLASRHYPWLFWIDGGSSILAGIGLFFTGLRCPHQVREVSQNRQSYWSLGRNVWMFLALYLVQCWVFLAYFSASSLYLVKSLGYSETACGSLWLLNTVLIVLTTIHVHHLTRSHSSRRLLQVASIMFGAGYLVILLFPGVIGLIAQTLFLTVGEMFLFANANSYLTKLVDSRQTGLAMGLMSMTAGLAAGLGALFVGWSFEHQSTVALWSELALAAVGSLIGYLLMPEPNRIPPAGEVEVPANDLQSA